MASLSVNAMRKELIKMYPGYTWKQRVLNMPENQIIAVYQRKIREGTKNDNSER